MSDFFYAITTFQSRSQLLLPVERDLDWVLEVRKGAYFREKKSLIKA